MTGTIGHEGDQLAVRCTIRARRELVHSLTDRVDYIDVAQFGIAADIVGLAHPSSFQNHRQCLRMVVDEQPIANIETSAVNRHCFASEPLDDCQRDELFWELMRSI